MHWEPMTVDEYAALQLCLGEKLVKVDGIWWRRVRPFFYRPLMIHVPVGEVSRGPTKGLFGAFQFGVTAAGAGNSTINYLMLDGLREYDGTQLPRRNRQLLRQASKYFVVRQIAEPDELKCGGHAAYISFYKRTRYSYLRERCSVRGFYRWVDKIFKFGRPLVLGGYSGNQLKGVSVSYRIADTVIYASLFIETEAMRENLGELMFHELRVRASQEAGVRQIFLRPYHGGNSQDCFYLHRGAKIVRQPAQLRINPTILWLLKRFSPARYAALTGIC